MRSNYHGATRDAIHVNAQNTRVVAKLTPERSSSAGLRTEGDALFLSPNSGVDTVGDLVDAHLLEPRVVDAELRVAQRVRVDAVAVATAAVVTATDNAHGAYQQCDHKESVKVHASLSFALAEL